ncbi:MAG: phospholipase D-like domain-containing protein [Candidatus Pacearchaeota archaeon]
MKKLKFIIAFILTLCISFTLGYLVSSRGWECPICSYNSNDITPLINEEYYPILINEINSAKTSIDIILYEFKWYEKNNSVVQLRDALVRAHNNGVNIRIILDQSEWYGKLTELSKENQKTANYLAEKGISVKLDSVKTTTHDKLIIIDNSTVILGSHNWGSSALTKNNEASVMIRGEVAKYYENYFDFLWINN